MNITRGHISASRYRFDSGACSASKGFAQIDTAQDASYFGTWANPFTFEIFCYCEGDTTLQKADSAEEFTQAIRELREWNLKGGWGFGIDPGWPGTESCRAIKEAFERLGLGEYLH